MGSYSREFEPKVAKIMSLKRTGEKSLNFATVATPLKLEGEAIYAASKAAIISLTEVLSKELAGFNITVNAVGPTPVKTDLIRSVPTEKMDALLHRQAINRFGTFEDISNVIDFFFKPESNFITGQTIYLGGV
jgi:3-oxoacyl-[acyl-carrier protein] reductase